MSESAFPNPATPELMVVMPVFNEQASLEPVVREWFRELSEHVPEFVFLAVDDGSTDETPKILARLCEELGPRLEVMRHANCGHGQSCLAGYHSACERRIPFVFQIDSDGQCDPAPFARFWEARHDFDVMYGCRVRREDGWRRALASTVLRGMLRVCFRCDCVDPNVPYRLMRTRVLDDVLGRIPQTFSLANVALAVLLQRDPAIRHGALPIRFRERHGGEPAVPFRRFAAEAVRLLGQLRGLLSADSTTL